MLFSINWILICEICEKKIITSDLEINLDKRFTKINRIGLLLRPPRIRLKR